MPMTPFLTPQAIHIAPSITALLSDKDGVKSVPAASEVRNGVIGWIKKRRK